MEDLDLEVSALAYFQDSVQDQVQVPVYQVHWSQSEQVPEDRAHCSQSEEVLQEHAQWPQSERVPEPVMASVQQLVQLAQVSALCQVEVLVSVLELLCGQASVE